MFSHTFKATSEEIIVTHSEKKGKIHEGRCVKEFFRSLAGWHLATSLQINFFTDTEAVVQTYSVKNVFLETLQNSQENTCARVSF